MRTILACLSLAVLAACGGAATSANDSAANGSAPAPTSNAAAPADNPADAPATAAADPARAGEVAECVADVANELPAGTDANAFCGCAVDGMQGGRGEREAMEACAAQMGIEPQGR